MEIKCFLFLDQFTAPIKTIVLDLPFGTTDQEIQELAEKKFKVGFRVELEDVKNPLHPPYDKELSADNPVVKQISERKILVGDHVFKRNDIMEACGLSKNQYTYLKMVKGHSMVEIYESGIDLYDRKRAG